MPIICPGSSSTCLKAGKPQISNSRFYESERRNFAIQLIDSHARIAGVMSGKVKGSSNDLLLKSMEFVSRFPPYSTLDLLKSDNIYKVVIMTGGINDTVQRQKLEELGNSLHGWLLRRPKMFQLYTIMLAKKEDATYTDVPSSLRPYWDTVFLDDVAFTERDGGGRAYQSFGVGPEGCLVLVRPDGHVAVLASLEAVEVLQALSSVKVPLVN
ncbi:thioredoxin-like protein [Rhizoctonia solani]|nr:thioredoxin-like protein [Rhizoctonia solani]